MGRITSKDYSDSQFKLSNRVTGHLSKRRDGYYSGGVYTKHGIVNVATQYDSYSYLIFVHKGVRYSRTWERSFSSKHMKTLAFEFADEIIKKTDQ